MQSTILQHKAYRVNMKLSTLNIAVLVLLLCFVCFLQAEHATRSNLNDEKNSKEEIQRVYDYGPYGCDLQRNIVSNAQFYTTNYGIFGNDVRQGTGGLHWPRGSQNQYLYGGGIWFAAQKMAPDNSGLRNYVELSYNPTNGNSWFVPGRIEDGDTAINNDESYQKYRTYFSTDFRVTDGKPINLDEGPNWPIWNISEISTDLFGSYVDDINQRNIDSYSQGPAFLSGEDILCVFKDTDLSRYDGGISFRKNYGYPLRLQFEHYIYTWGFGDYRDIVLLKYNMINYSEDTLKNCWIAPVLDPDIALSSNSSEGAKNDKIRYYGEEDSLNLVVTWTNGDKGENDKGFGYMGVALIETPAVDENGFLRKDKTYYPENSQLGLKTFRNWPIKQDLSDDNLRYNYISAGVKDDESEAGDIRLIMSTGPFNMLPRDTVKFVYALVFSRPSYQEEADGTTPDLAELVRKLKVARDLYSIAVTGIDEEHLDYTGGLSIKNIFPNPANDFCKIEYYLPKAEKVNIEITNLYGMSVLGITNETVQNGLNSVEINTKSLSSGAYFVTLRTATEHISKLINIIK